MSERKGNLEVVVGGIVTLAAIGAQVVAWDAQLDGGILGELRPRIRWAWRCLVAAVASTWHAPEVISGAEDACVNSPWRPTWNRRPGE